MASQDNDATVAPGMRWPVFVDPEPMDVLWRPGMRVEVQLVWLDDPDLSDDLVLHDVEMDGTALPMPGGRGTLSLLRRGGLTAAWRVRVPTGRVRVSGLPYWDRYAHVTLPAFPPTVGVVRRVTAVHRRRARRPDHWERLAEPARARDVPDTSPRHLRSDPPGPAHRESTAEPAGHPAGQLRFLSTAEYLREFGHLLPERQWQAAGFLVELEVVDR